jgi:hypothetical protein
MAVIGAATGIAIAILFWKLRLAPSSDKPSSFFDQ